MYQKNKISQEEKAANIVTAVLNEHFNLVGCDLNDKAYDVMQALLQCKDKNYKYSKKLKKFLSYAVMALAKENINYTKFNKGKDWTTLVKITEVIKKNKMVSCFYQKPSTLAKQTA